MAGLDAMDIRILDLLQDDASRPIAEIADAVHLSHNACWRRIRQLEEAGIIKRRVALLDAEKLGVGTTVFVMLRAPEYSDEWFDNFAAVVRRIPEVLEFYRLAGEIDYLIKLQVSDIAGYNRVSQALTRTVHFRDVSGAFAMEELKNTSAIPLPRGQEPPAVSRQRVPASPATRATQSRSQRGKRNAARKSG